MRVGKWGSEVKTPAVSVVEHKLLGDILLMILIALFGLALPIYWFLRKKAPESGWNFGGNVTTAGLQNFDLLGVGAIACFVTLTWKLQGAQMGKPMPEITVSAVLASALTYLSIAAVIPASLFWRVKLGDFFGLRWQKPMQILWLIPLFLAIMIICGGLLDYAGWQKWVEDHGGGAQAEVATLAETQDIKLILALAFAAAISAPIAEEIVFRGYIYPVVKRFTERNFATLFSAALFAVAHFNLNALPLLFVFGIIMVFVYEYTSSIWAPVICHMVFNGLQIGVLLGYRFLDQGAVSLLP